LTRGRVRTLQGRPESSPYDDAPQMVTARESDPQFSDAGDGSGNRSPQTRD
jgi:hypothetical protein